MGSHRIDPLTTRDATPTLYQLQGRGVSDETTIVPSSSEGAILGSPDTYQHEGSVEKYIEAVKNAILGAAEEEYRDRRVDIDTTDRVEEW